ncbi:hypothetical protein QRX50_26895 [Amycolatopsis carbonis]|uniref:Uncharacterized protein n=1 Tax=Amycolatopsis carbonis TaxID=715471 RepID=A0A9Y2I8Y5_9PSEU|nr:hypothetical protein [Amycolatopsis sp. 2-15]WIX75169.1 hypothetical protein QRX50_26895 [Amycolatopsis sp. 2-15]
MGRSCVNRWRATATGKVRLRAVYSRSTSSSAGRPGKRGPRPAPTGRRWQALSGYLTVLALVGIAALACWHLDGDTTMLVITIGSAVLATATIAVAVAVGGAKTNDLDVQPIRRTFTLPRMGNVGWEDWRVPGR